MQDILRCQYTYSDPTTNHFRFSKDKLELLKRKEYDIYSLQDNPKKAHEIAKILFTPWQTTLSFMSRVVQPLPGEGKEHSLKGIGIRVSAFAAFFCTLLPAGVTALLGIPFYVYSHSKRPIIGYVNNGTDKSENGLVNHITLRTHNVAMVHNFMRISNDLRDTNVRAHEFVEAVLNDPNAPNVMCLQETFNETATQILCEGLKVKYPHIIHSVAPHISGFNSGLMILSQFPIEELTYRRFDNCLGEEALATKGLLGARLKVGNDKYVNIYNVHTQGLPGHKRAAVRFKQLHQVCDWIEADLKNPAYSGRTFLMGDFNISKISAWGELNDEEQESFNFLEQRFHNILTKDHHPLTLERVSGSRMFCDGRPEPHGTWENGPFPEKPSLFKWEDRLYRKWHGLSSKVKADLVKPFSGWGLQNQWAQSVTSAAFDYILSVKEKDGEGLRVNDRAEIHRIDPLSAKTSGISDHLPVDAIVEV